MDVKLLCAVFPSNDDFLALIHFLNKRTVLHRPTRALESLAELVVTSALMASTADKRGLSPWKVNLGAIKLCVLVCGSCQGANLPAV